MGRRKVNIEPIIENENENFVVKSFNKEFNFRHSIWFKKKLLTPIDGVFTTDDIEIQDFLTKYLSD